MYFSIVLYSLL